MNTPPVYTLLLVDDHPMMRRGLRQLLDLEDDLLVIGEAGNGLEALHMVMQLQPQLVLLDNNMPELNGVETLKRLREQGYTGKVLLFTVSDDEADVRDALRFGADGYLLKEDRFEVLVEELQKIVRGQPPLSPSIARRLLRHFQPPVAASDGAALTARENDVLRLVAKGLTTAEVAELLALSRHTVAGYLKDIYRKLSIGTRAEATLEAARRGLVRN